MEQTIRAHEECPYGADECPKVHALEKKVLSMEKNQHRMMFTLYFIAGVVSVSLGVQIV